MKISFYLFAKPEMAPPLRLAFPTATHRSSTTYHFFMLCHSFPDREHEAVPILSNDLSLENGNWKARQKSLVRLSLCWRCHNETSFSCSHSSSDSDAISSAIFFSSSGVKL
jgi:hypothetical protein